MSPVAWTSWASTHISTQNPAPSTFTRWRSGAQSTRRTSAPNCPDTRCTASSRACLASSRLRPCRTVRLISGISTSALRPDLDDQLDLDGHVGRQAAVGDHRAHVHAAIAEERPEQVGGAIDDRLELLVAVHTVDEAHHLHDACDAIEVGDDGLDAGQTVERRVARGKHRVLWR